MSGLVFKADNGSVKEKKKCSTAIEISIGP